MNVAMLLEMAADGLGERIAVGSRSGGLSYASLLERSRRVASWLDGKGVENVGFVDLNSEALPIALFASSMAGTPFVPLNYRLPDEQLRALLARIAPVVVVVDAPVVERVGTVEGIELVTRDELLARACDEGAPSPEGWTGDPDAIAVLLFTSGTTGEPKAAVLRHRHLVSYVITTVEFMGSSEDDAALVSVPPYHVAGISAVLTSAYSGRRMIQLASFDPESWVRLARDEGVTHAMLVPTMLQRILDVVEEAGEALPDLRLLSYGGGRMPVPIIERALQALPHVDFVNAYGLTETSSTISVLGPEDHRAAMAGDDPAVRSRLGSVGRPLPTLELEIRDPAGRPVADGERGEVWVRGEQVSGEYLGRQATREDGWFPTHDSGYLDAEGYLFVEGRLDDVIVRGGENMAPGEIEEVLLRHPGVAEAGVVGLPDTEWGEKVVAAVVPADGQAPGEDDLRAWVRDHLRSSRTPERIVFVSELPYTETGKLLRRVLRADLATS